MGHVSKDLFVPVIFTVRKILMAPSFKLWLTLFLEYLNIYIFLKNIIIWVLQDQGLFRIQSNLLYYPNVKHRCSLMGGGRIQEIRP